MKKNSQNLIAGISVAGIITLTGIIIGFSNQNQQTAPAQTNSNLSSEFSNSAEPKIETKTETSTRIIPYETTYIDNNTLEKGKTKITTPGVAGTEVITYEVTYTNGIETNRKAINSEITQQPTNEVIARGTYVAPQINTKQTSTQNCNIKGNISKTGEKIYHLPGQQFYDRTVIDTSAGERWFCSEAEAQAAGWRKSKR